MGMWCIQALAGNYLAGLIAIDVDDAKLEMAKGFGATASINSKNEVPDPKPDFPDSGCAEGCQKGMAPNPVYYWRCCSISIGVSHSEPLPLREHT